MKEKLVYDLPTRVFHWIFALLFITAFVIGKNFDDDCSLFSYHMMAGLMLGLVVILRIIWGVFGTRYARLSGFALNPAELVAYFQTLLKGGQRKWTGHNPASSWAAIGMLILTVGLVSTGLLLSNGSGGDSVEELHELLANGFLIVVILHIAGVVLHSLRHKDAIWQSMLSGKKQDVPEDGQQIRPNIATGILFLFIVLGCTTYLVKNFDSGSRKLNILGTQIFLGEAEDEEHEHKSHRNKHKSKRKHREYDRDDD